MREALLQRLGSILDESTLYSPGPSNGFVVTVTTKPLNGPEESWSM
jgi:hypothetical protein